MLYEVITISLHACIVGDGAEMPAIRELVASLDLGSTVSLPGMVHDTDNWYRKMDFYIVSSDEEGLPVSMLEAMSFGLPVIATDVGAIGEVIETVV